MRHDVVYERAGSSALAQAITRLSGDDGAPDPTERLVIALRRAGVIDGKTMVTLLSRYLNEKFHVRPVVEMRYNEGLPKMIEIPTVGLATFVADLAMRHNVAYERTDSSDLAQAITRLSGDDGAPDPTERLIIALRRAEVIDGKTMLTLQGRYLDEKVHVRPGR